MRVALFSVFKILLGFNLSWFLATSAGAQEKPRPLFLSFEQRYLLALFIEHKSANQNSLLNMQDLAKSFGGQEPVKVRVSSFDDFLIKFKGEWPNTHSLRTDLKVLREQGVAPQIRHYVSESPRVQRQIESYLLWQQQELMHLVSQKTKSLEQVLNLADMNSSEKLGFDEQVLEKYFIAEMERIKNSTDNLLEVKSRAGLEQGQQLVLKLLLKEYFQRLSPTSKEQMLSVMLGQDLKMTDLQKLEVLIQNSGPQLQKLLQIMARQSDFAPEVKEIFKNLESAVRPVPWVLVSQIIESEKKNYSFASFEKEPLGVGSMAQVHRAKLNLQGKKLDVVVRFIKPDIAERIQEDHRILTEVAALIDADPQFKQGGVPKLSPIVQDITNTVMAELNQQETIERQLQGKVYNQAKLIETADYKTYLEVKVPKIFVSEGESQLMVQEMVFGKKIDKAFLDYQNVMPLMKKRVVEELVRIWSHEALFGSGFYHSDLHHGNFLVDIKDSQITLNILDFGMGGTISSELQKQILILGAGVELNRGDLLAQVFWEISEKSKNQIQQDEFMKVVLRQSQELQTLSEKWGIEKWTAFAMDAGIKLPFEFISLNRGLVILNKLLIDVGSGKTVTSFFKEAGLRHPAVIYKSLVLSKKISHTELGKIGWTEILNKIEPQWFKASGPKKLLIRCEGVFI